LTSAIASDRNSSSAELEPELPLVLTTKTVPGFKWVLNSTQSPSAQKFFNLPSIEWQLPLEFKKLQKIKVSLWWRMAALFSMICPFMGAFTLVHNAR
jgi:hypothetical protein